MKSLMDLFIGKLRKSTPQTPKKPVLDQFSRTNARLRHKRIVDNLTSEYESLAYALRDLETDTEIIKSEREKQSNNIIARMTLIKYEIDIREGLLKWL